MSDVVPVAVTARNEERAIAVCLQRLRAAVAFAEARLPLRFQLLVVVNDCTDRTEEIVRGFSEVEIIHATGGIVEAQRAAVRPAPFLVYSDADIAVEENVLFEVARVLLDRPALQVAYPAKSPLPPARRSLLARALYLYNRRDGFQTRRRYFNGKFFAIRRWEAPTLAELQPRLDRLPVDRFYNYHAGMRIDDVYLSRRILHDFGPEAIVEVPEARLWFRPPETLAGMYRYYKRMRLEIERLDVLFPELREVHRRHGVRGVDTAALAAAPAEERRLWRCFHLALWACKIAYRLERFYYRRLARGDCPVWRPIEETKRPIAGVCGPPG